MGWTLLGLLLGSHTWFYRTLGDRPISWTAALGPALANAWMGALLTPPVLWLAARFPVERGSLGRGLLVHVTAALLFVSSRASIVAAWPQLAGWAPDPSYSRWLLLKVLLAANFHLDFLTYAALVGLWQYADARRRRRDRELQASRLEADLAEARLSALRAQLQPHFLFNTLHAISALVHEDPEAADRMLTQLSELLRMSLERSEAQEITLGQELEMLDRYLSIQQARFQDRLAVLVDVDPHLLGAQVPTLILQPLVENAIRHGLAPRAVPGRLEIHARRRDGRLSIEVRDDGVGLHSNHEGRGLKNTRARLQHLYGAEQELTLTPLREGLSACLSIPYREEGASP
jgi:signal transduction histidine kinase